MPSCRHGRSASVSRPRTSARGTLGPPRIALASKQQSPSRTRSTQRGVSCLPAPAAGDVQVGEVLAAGPGGVRRAGGIARPRRAGVERLVGAGVVVLDEVVVVARVLE